MQRKLSGFIVPLLTAVIFVIAAQNVNAQGTASKKKVEGVLLKDIARISGIRTNQLLGYGLVVGLPGSGDTRSMLAVESIQNLLANLGRKFILIEGKDLGVSDCWASSLQRLF